MCSRRRRGARSVLAVLSLAGLAWAVSGCSCPGDPGHPVSPDAGPPSMSASAGAGADVVRPSTPPEGESEPFSLADVEAPDGLTMESPLGSLHSLQAGDVLIEVNGTELSSPMGVRHAYLDLNARGGEDEVTYRRGGEIMTMTVGRGEPEAASGSRRSRAITREGANRFQVDRSLLATEAADAEALAEQLPTLAPAAVEGVGSGQRLMRIERQSIFRQLGLRDGDIVMQVGGMPFETPSQLLEQLLDPAADEVTVSLVRRGRERELTYTVWSGPAQAAETEPEAETQPEPESQPDADGP